MQDREHETAIPPRRILVATDFSPASAAARDHALLLAAPAAEVTVLHSTLLPVPIGSLQPEWMPEEASYRFELLDRLRVFSQPARMRGCVVRLDLQEGLPSETIIGRARAIHADLVALGTHGRRGLERWVVGSTAQRVLRMCPAPVLTTSSVGGPHSSRLRHILCAVGSSGNTSTVGRAHELAMNAGARLICVHVVEAAGDPALGLTDYVSAELRTRERIGAALRAVGAEPCEVVVTAGRTEAEILKVAAVAGADVIVMGAHDVRPAQAGLCGSTVERVVRDAFCPVLTIRETAIREGVTSNRQDELTTAR
jgi:nucleotide-binding universal stress UspA family protein